MALENMDLRVIDELIEDEWCAINAIKDQA
jgi:hypothetical protein